MMKICVLTHAYPKSKNDICASFIEALCEKFQTLGEKVSVLASYNQEFSRRPPGDHTVNLRTYKYIFPRNLHLLGYGQTLEGDLGLKRYAFLLAPLMIFFGTVALFRLSLEEKPDILHAHWILPNGFMAAIVSYLTNIPLVISLPGSDVFLSERNFLFKAMSRFAFRKASLITTNSPDLRDRLIKLGADPRKFELIIYGVDPEDFHPTEEKKALLREKLNINSTDVIVLSVARLVYKKGHEYLIKSIPELVKEYENLKFVIVGEGERKKELVKLARSLGVEEYLRFPGTIWRDEILYYYNLADVFIMPSIRDSKGNIDGLSVSMVEAMACGKPIVASNIAGNALVVRDGENGFLIGEKNPGEIAAAIKKLVKSDSLRQKFGQSSRQRVLDEFTWEKLAQRYINAFNKLSEGKCSA